uniref:TFIIS N-terminal domain-containing protein n=2 Tax=Parascaris univalens TaxID=6257 RepID=A0A915A7A8_PARUN
YRLYAYSMADNDLPSFIPPPTQFLQEEASEDDYGDDEDEEFDQPLLQIKLNGRAARNSQRGFSIPTSSFYGPSEEAFQRQQQFAASHHDYAIGATSTAFGGRREMYATSSTAVDPSSLYEERAPSDSSGGLKQPQQVALIQQQQQQLYQQQNLPEPRVVSNESNRYTIVGHTQEGQPIYALQSTSHPERPNVQPLQQIYRVADASGQPRYAYALAPPSRAIQQHPIRTIAREYYVHSNEVLNEMQPTPAISNVEIAAAHVQQEAPLQASSSQIMVVQATPSLGKLRKKAASAEDDQKRSEQISGSAVAAQAGAIQRFGTLAGWKQMGAWLKTAERNGDWNRLKLLLSQCAQANLTVELLQANDTPKFVRKLSKSCVDIDVRKVSGDLVLRWKNLIASPSTTVQNEEPKRVGSAKRKTPHPQSHSLDMSTRLTKKSKETSEPRKARLDAKRKSDDQNAASDARKSSLDGDSTSVEQRNEGEEVVGGPEDSQKAEPSRVAAVVQKSKSDSATTIESEAVAVKSEGAKKAQSTSGTEKGEKSDKSSSPKASNKLSEFNMFEKLGQERREDKRPKRSRTYMAKFRSTGAVDLIRSQRMIVRSVLMYIVPFYLWKL